MKSIIVTSALVATASVAGAQTMPMPAPGDSVRRDSVTTSTTTSTGMRMDTTSMTTTRMTSDPMVVKKADAGDVVTAGHGSFYLEPYAGYIVYGNLANFQNGYDLSNKNGGIYGVQAGYSLSPNFSLVGNFAYNKSKFTFKGPTDASDVNTSGDIGVFLYDGAIQARLPFLANSMGSSVAPFVQAGVGAIRYTTDANDISSSSETNVMFPVGAGLDFQVRPLIGIRLMARDYITSLAFDKFSDVDNAIRNDSKVSHNFAFTAGLNFGF